MPRSTSRRLRNHFTASVRGDPTRLREWTAAAWGEQAYEVGIDGIGPGPPLSPRASSAGEILDAYERLADVLNGRRYCDLIVREAGGHEPLAANYPSHPYRSCMIPPLRPLSGDKDAIKATLGVSTAGRFFRGDDQMRPKGRAYTVISAGNRVGMAHAVSVAAVLGGSRLRTQSHQDSGSAFRRSE